MENSPTYCKLSHISLAIQNEGDVCVCNKNTESFKDGKWNKLYLHEAGLEKIWKSPTRKLIIASLDSGKRHSSCSACWNDEDSGIESTRQQFNAKFSDISESSNQPRILILKPTNTCNMGCRPCQPSTSTTLYQDFYQRDTELGTFSGTMAEYTKGFEKIRLGLSKNNLSVWDVYEQWLPGLHFVDIYGGEPMLAPAMWDRMIKSANEGKTQNTSIQFHTNGTIWNQEYINLLPKFKNVAIGFSIDSNDDEQLKYLRYKVDIEKLHRNLEKYINLSKEYGSISVKISFTVSIYNIWYADTIFKELTKLSVPVYINVVYGPEHYDMRHLPVPVKKQIINKLSESSGIPELDKLSKLLSNTVPGCDIYWPKFWKEVEIFDRIRNQSFAKTFPEYYEAIKPYLNAQS